MNEKDFFKKMVGYIPGRLALGVLGFVPIILLTKLLKPEQYGEYKIVFIGVSLLLIFTTGWMNQAIIRFWHNFPNKKILYTTTTISILSINIVALFVVIIANSIWHFIDTYLLIATIPLFFSRPIFDLNTSVYRSLELLKKFNHVEFIRVFANILGILLLVPLFNSFGALAAMGISFFIVNLLSLMNFRNFLSFSKEYIDLNTFKEQFVYGYPLIFTMFSSVIISYSDQFIIGLFQDRFQVGIYAANYDILEKTLLYINGVFMLATTPKLMKVYDNSGIKEAKKFNSLIFEVFIATFLPLSFFIVLNDRLIISILSSQDYFYSRIFIILIILSMLVNILNMYMIKGLTVLKNTKKIAKIFIIASLINIVLNLMLIPKYSLYGAIISTLVSYTLMLVLSTSATINHRILTINLGKWFTQIIVYSGGIVLIEQLFNYNQKVWVGLLLIPCLFLIMNIKTINRARAFLMK